jgi:hypothetical protein
LFLTVVDQQAFGFALPFIIWYLSLNSLLGCWVDLHKKISGIWKMTPSQSMISISNHWPGFRKRKGSKQCLMHTSSNLAT